MHSTYIIGSPNWNVKVGHSRDPQARVRELQTGSPVGLWVAHTWSADHGGAVALEQALHKAFAWRAMAGEWFDLTPAPVIAVGDLIWRGRNADADRLLAIIQRREAIIAEGVVLRDAWRWVRGSDRRRVELEAAAGRKALEAEDAALQLAAYDLGLWPEGVSEKRLPERLEILRRAAA